MISDASPLILLAKVNRLDLLHALDPPVLVPETVWEECTGEQPTTGESRALQAARDGGLLRVVADLAPSAVRAFDFLDRGEAQALAQATRAGHAVLLDDHQARTVATGLGIPHVGVLGLVVLAFRQGRVDAVTSRKIVQALLDAGLWVGTSVLAAVYERLEKP